MNSSIIQYFVHYMSQQSFIHKYFEENGIKYNKSDTYAKLARNNKIENIDLSDFTINIRNSWKECPVNFHLNNLQSGLLKGHSWHGARASFLHMSLQEKVRECIDGKYDINYLLNIGTDIIKHEYFMVATHDLCESTIIKNFHKCIPSLRKKSISDFIFEGLPYDLKNTNPIDGVTKKNYKNQKVKIIQSLFEGADNLRNRKQAIQSYNDWGYNRFYIIVENQERWLSSPQEILDELVYECKEIKEPIKIERSNLITYNQIILI